MRMLGINATLPTFRWDLIYLVAELLADTRPGVSALAAPVQASLTKLASERAGLEDAEDQAVVASALLHKRDKRRDDVLIEAGGVARASSKAVYDTLFPSKNPSATARLSIEDESTEMSRILGELAKLPQGHPIRSAYEQSLIDAEAAVKTASAQTDTAATALALQRSQIGRLKLEMDELRLTTHSQIVTLLKSKEEADSFFRPTTSAPTGAKSPGEPAAPPEAPAPPPNPA